VRGDKKGASQAPEGGEATAAKGGDAKTRAAAQLAGAAAGAKRRGRPSAVQRHDDAINHGGAPARCC